jgi:hypothetical protein
MKGKNGTSAVAHYATGASEVAATTRTAFMNSSIGKNRLVDNPDPVCAVGYIKPRLAVKRDPENL